MRAMEDRIELIEFIWKFQIQQIRAEFFGEDSSCLAPNLRAAAVDEELQPFKYPQWANKYERVNNQREFKS